MLKDKKNPEFIKVKLLSKKNVAETAGVYRLAFKKADVGERWDQASAEKYIQHCLEKQPDLFFVAISEEEIIGGVAGEIKPWWDGIHLAETELFVHPNHQGKGVAKMLLAKVLEEAIKKYNIQSFEGIADGKRHKFPMEWYKRIGFEESGWVHIWGSPKEMLSKLKK